MTFGAKVELISRAIRPRQDMIGPPPVGDPFDFSLKRRAHECTGTHQP